MRKPSNKALELARTNFVIQVATEFHKAMLSRLLSDEGITLRALANVAFDLGFDIDLKIFRDGTAKPTENTEEGDR